MKLLVLGSDGMVGHVVSLFLKERGHSATELPNSGINIRNVYSLESIIREGAFGAVINCTAVINNDAEADKAEAVLINTLLPHLLERITQGTETVIVHRSTDCIFSGKKGKYSLEDIPDAKSFYGRSKALGELLNSKDITIRTSLIGPEMDINGKGLFNWFYNQKGDVPGYANAIWSGITTIEYAKAVEWFLRNKKHGLFQLVPRNAISKYDLLNIFEKYYPGERKINRIENERIDKSLVPVCGGYDVFGYEKQIIEMKQWTDSHKAIYRY